MRYIDNAQIRLGVDLSRGGAITYLAREGGPNMVNDYDLGRQIQMSYYAGPVPFTPNGKQPSPAWRGLGWNPIQSGDCFGHASKTLHFESHGDRLYLKCIPMQWPLDNEPGECTFESWIRLDGNAVRVRNFLVNHRADRTQYPARTQELPAVYTNGPWYRLVTYVGNRPFTGAATSDMPVTFPWTSWQSTENWTALLDAHGDGVGVYEPGVQTFSGGFAGQPGAGGPKDGPTGYIAPNLEEILDWNVQYDDSYVLILGHVDAIRSWVYAHRQADAMSAPVYDFGHDRQHWYPMNAVDAGWPIRGGVRVKMEHDDPQMIGPAGLWSAANAPKLYIRGALRSAGGGPQMAQVFWSRFDAPGFSQACSVTFPMIGDGRERTYDLDLAQSPAYHGEITRLRFDPEPAGHPGDEIVVRSIRLGR
jgi:hypothetical protein